MGKRGRLLLVVVAILVGIVALVLPAPGGAANYPVVCQRSTDWCGVTVADRADVWIQGDTSQDRADLQSTAGMLDELWKPETDLLGPPLPDTLHPGDDGNKDSLIDVYLVTPSEHVTRDGSSHDLDGSYAVTYTATPSGSHPDRPHGLSAFILVDLNRLHQKPVAFRTDLAHEFFHALQFAHNATADNSCTAHNWWFYDASATWAEAHFVPSAARSEVYDIRFRAFQDATRLGLQDVSDGNAYDSFIWAYFMQQQIGITAISAVWTNTNSAANCAGLTAALQRVFPFESNFPLFALRNLDRPSVYVGIRPTYQQLDPSFPEIAPTMTKVELHLAGGGGWATSVSTPPLRATYYDVSVPANVKKVTIDTHNVEDHPHRALLYFVTGNPTWSYFGNSPPTETLNTCSIRQFVFLLSNVGLDTPLRGRIVFTPGQQSCSSGRQRTVGSR